MCKPQHLRCETRPESSIQPHSTPFGSCLVSQATVNLKSHIIDIIRRLFQYKNPLNPIWFMLGFSGDLAHEFYDVVAGGLRRITEGLMPQVGRLPSAYPPVALRS